MFIGDGSTKLSCKRALPGLPNLEINITGINAALSRGPEVSIATPPKALELETIFNSAIAEALELRAVIRFEHTQAMRSVNNIRARVMLERVDSVLKNKSLSSTADYRKAALEADREYQDALDVSDALNALSEFIDGKLEALKNYYFNAKDVIRSFSSENGIMGKRQVSVSSEWPDSNRFMEE
ncbi:MAG: hypothetical protein KGO96_07600 [Elusimicrobia bacterium]|nr:hypothetical protein [Elusimicrobiota bacterium]